MADASSIRRAATLPVATGRNKASVRYDDGTNTVVVSDGVNWNPITYFDIVYNGALMFNGVFYLATRPVEIVAIRETHSVAGSDSGAVSLQIVKTVGVDAPATGVNLLTNNTNTGFDLKALANSFQTGALTATVADRKLADGERLSVKFTGILSAVSGVIVTVTLKYI